MKMNKKVVAVLALVALMVAPGLAFAQVTPVAPQVNVGRVGVTSPTLVTGTAAAGQISSTLGAGCGSTASYTGLVNTDFAGRFTSTGTGQTTTCTQTLGGSYTGTAVTNSLYCTAFASVAARNPVLATVNVTGGVATVTYVAAATIVTGDVFLYQCLNAGGQ